MKLITRVCLIDKICGLIGPSIEELINMFEQRESL